jgi:hypothetical protein
MIELDGVETRAAVALGAALLVCVGCAGGATTGDAPLDDPARDTTSPGSFGPQPAAMATMNAAAGDAPAATGTAGAPAASSGGNDIPAVQGADDDATSPGGDVPLDRAPGLGPLVVADGFESLAPPLGEPLPPAPAGEWTYLEIPGTSCRDGSPAGIHYRFSDSSPNYFVFLEGGGACFDDFFCPLNPQNVHESVDGESILQAALLNFGGAAKVAQTPRVDGIFKDDPRNPVAGWNAVYVPYCSGDVYAGTRDSAEVPRWPAGGAQSFTGYRNASIIGGRVVATFLDADKALLTGSSAGGVGSLVNAGQFADLLAAHTQTRGFIVSDSGPVFDDPYLEPCIQNEWRQLWGIDAALPPDCEGCFAEGGGGMVAGLADYLFSKYPDGGQVVGGLISSYDDEIMSMFFSKGLDQCQGNPLYPAGRYRAGLESFRDEMVDKERFSTYFMAGTLHMHIFEPRFYTDNGTGTTIAEWLTKLLNNEAMHVAAP